MVGEDLCSPSFEGLGEGGELGSGFGCFAPGDGVIEVFFGDVGGIGQIDVPDLFLRYVTIAYLPVGVAVTQRPLDTFPAPFIDAFGSHEQQFADVVERVALPSAMGQGRLLDTLPAPRYSLIREPHDMKRIDDNAHFSERRRPSGERVGFGHRVAITLMGVDRNDLDGGQPTPGHFSDPGPQILASRPSKTSRI